jgi:hypothetical protein
MLRFYPSLPNGDGNYSQFDGSDGNQVNNYQLVDEVPANVTDYVETVTVDQFDSYDLADIALSVGATILAVIPTVYSVRDGDAEEIALGTRLGGADLVGSDQVPPSGYSDKAFLNERQTTKPGGGAWAEADVNNAEIVIKSRGSY